MKKLTPWLLAAVLALGALPAAAQFLPSSRPCKMDGSDCNTVPYPLLAPAGSAAAPSYSFAADPNTGIFNTADQLHFSVGGTEYAALYAGQFSIFGTLTLSGTSDAGLARSAAGVVKVTDGGAGGGTLLTADGTAGAPAYAFATSTNTGLALSTGPTVYMVVNGNGSAQFSSTDLFLPAGNLTAGTMNYGYPAGVRSLLQRFDWTNAMIVALGGVGSGDIKVATLPAKTVVKNAYVVIVTPDVSANALTVACGRTSATYIDYIVASNAKAAANTVYGDASGERGTNLTGYDLPSYTAATDVYCHFIKTTSFLNTVSGSTGAVYLETMILP